MPPYGSASALDALLSDLGSRLRRGGQLEVERGGRERARRCGTGFAEVDRLLGGGFPRGRMSEIAGPPSSGRTSLALGLLATVTGAGETAALVDRADAFDPASAEAAGVDLERVLWLRARDPGDALRCIERLLQTDGFALVVLDETTATTALPSTTALRLSRLTAGGDAALVLLGRERLAGPHAEIALELRPGAARFAGTPALLEELEIGVHLTRHRTAPAGRTVSLRLRSIEAA